MFGCVWQGGKNNTIVVSIFLIQTFKHNTSDNWCCAIPANVGTLF